MADSQEKNEIEKHIMNLVIECLSSGERLPPEKKLAEELGVSRSSLREVLRSFESSGILVAMQGSGRIVRTPDVSSSIIDGWNILLRAHPALLLELLDVRSVLECGFLPIAIEKLQLKDLQLMRDLVDRMMARALKNEIFVEEDKEFHYILFSRTENILLDQLLKAFWNLFEQSTDLQRSDELVRGAELHKQLFEAILTKNHELAVRLMKEQFNDIRCRLSQELEKVKTQAIQI